MINNTIFTSNSNLGTVYSNGINNLIMQTLQNQVSRLSKKDTSYAEMLKIMQKKVNAETDSVQTKTTVDMTMDEYKTYIADEIKKYSFDATRFDDDEVIQISNGGWQKMKSDSNYESWVLDKIKSSRLSQNQLASMGFGGSYYILSFGAEKSDFNEQTWIKNFKKLDNFFSGIYSSSGLFGTKSRTRSSNFGNVFSMQDERFQLQTQLARNQIAIHQQIQSTIQELNQKRHTTLNLNNILQNF